MNNFEIHDAATDLAAGRTAYSLAREVLGLRAQVAELRREREENIGTLAAQDAILGIIRNRLGVPAAPLRKPQGEKLIEALSRQCEELAQLRKTLACMEAKEGEELTELYQKVNDLGAVLEYVGQALDEPLEPLHTFDERVRTAAKALEGLVAADKRRVATLERLAGKLEERADDMWLNLDRLSDDDCEGILRSSAMELSRQAEEDLQP